MLPGILVCLAAAAATAAPSAPHEPRLEEVAEAVRPSVVEILGTVEISGETSYGTGFVIHEKDLVATNAHVVRGVRNVMVRTLGGALLASVEVLHSDATLDLAILRVTGLDARPLSVVPGGPPPVGTPVIAVGHPRGYEFTVSEGIVSALRKLDEKGVEQIQTTAPISPGSSGGPLLDRRGRVVGVCSLTLVEGQNINFAIPAEQLPPFIARALDIERALASEGAGEKNLSPEALARLVQRHRERGDLTRAGKLARRSLDRHPKSVALLLEAAEVAWSKASYPEVEALVRRVKVLQPGRPEALQIEASLLAERGECSEAIARAREALGSGLDPEREAEAHGVLADCLAREGAVTEALGHCDAALRSSRVSELPDYHALRAFLLQSLGRLEEADAAAVSALELSAWDPIVISALREWGLPRLVEVLSHRSKESASGRETRGVVRNRGPIALEAIQVSVEGLDAQGVPVATGTSTVSPARLVPGQTGSFRVVLEGLVEDVHEVVVRVVDYREP